MKLYVSPRAPNPRRVQMFIAEKGITGIEEVVVDLVKGEHRSSDHRARSPLAKVPVLELDDGRYLGETRAICSYLEGLYPEPNLMGETFEERAFIEMTDRRVELYLFGGIMPTASATPTPAWRRSSSRSSRTSAARRARRCARWRAGSTRSSAASPSSPASASPSPTSPPSARSSSRAG
jgi:glutathione S-transferase